MQLWKIALVPLVVVASCFAQETRRQYLSGRGTDDAVNWEFFCSDGARSRQWTTIPVPSCWDAIGFGKLQYGHPPRGEAVAKEQGKYRYKFNVPAEWNELTVYLVFEGSMTDTQAWVNGQLAGPMHQGAFYKFKYDVTKLVKLGQENLLEVTVDKESADESVNRAERRGDYWNFGGIFRPVYLEAVPMLHIDRVAIDAKADGSFTMDVFSASPSGPYAVEARIHDSKNQAVGQPVSAKVVDGKARIETKIDSPKAWTAETPELYRVDVVLTRDANAVHHISQRFGFRSIEVRKGEGIFVNGQRVLLKGTDRHTFWPESGRASNEKISRDDVALMKEMNNNAVRMSHYPPDEHFLEACDEAGIYVLDELAGWHQSYDTPTGKRLIEETVTRDVNHPCILFWDNGNEGGWNRENDDEFARWDPQQREVLHPWEKFRNTNTKHYPHYDVAVELVKGPEIFFPTEFQHALFDGGGGVALADYWDVIRNGKASGGGFIWAFVDEAVKRPDTGKMDTQGNQAPDGVLGPYREKEGSFYAIKQIWSPIVVKRDPGGSLMIENRYDFTNADQCTFNWGLRRFSKPGEKPGFTLVASGQLPKMSIAPHATQVVKMDLPPAQADADALAIAAYGPHGKELWTWVWPIRDIKLGTADEQTKANVKATEDADAIKITTNDLAVSFSKKNGRLSSAARGEAKFSLLDGPRLPFGDAQLQSIEHRVDGAEHVVSVSFSGGMKAVTWRVHPNGWVDLDYRYTCDVPCDYFGVSFDLPEADVKSMKWLGNGPYRVWKNRLEGGILGVWEKAYNTTQTGYRDWIYPEFKGYYSQIRWMQIQTTSGPITVALDDPSLFVQVLKPDFPASPKPASPTTMATAAVKQQATLSANAWANIPDAGFSILHGIAPMGTKFQIPYQLGPQSQQNRPSGEHHGTAHFYFGELK